jgi:signal transduction histidine kinase
VIGDRLPPGSKDAAITAEIVSRIDSLNGLMQDLLLFARTPQPNPAPTDVAPLVGTTADLLSGDPALADFRIDVEGSSPPIVADAELLKIVFTNLIVNGAHAMRGQGSIRVLVEAADGFCQVAFVDRGPGIPGEIRDRIFTPFFTTKLRGTGLGLPTAKRIVEAHRGTISIDCPPAGGTTVTVRLPLADLPSPLPAGGPVLERA